jgi:hypothetical protein
LDEDPQRPWTQLCGQAVEGRAPLVMEGCDHGQMFDPFSTKRGHELAAKGDVEVVSDRSVIDGGREPPVTGRPKRSKSLLSDGIERPPRAEPVDKRPDCGERREITRFGRRPAIRGKALSWSGISGHAEVPRSNEESPPQDRRAGSLWRERRDGFGAGLPARSD